MFDCEVCKKSFDSYRKLNGHKSVHREGGRYSVSRQKPKITIFCAGCGKSTTNPKFCNSYCQQVYIKKTLINQVEAGLVLSENRMKRYILETRGRVCEECGIGEQWNNKPLVLQLDHIDGNSDNNLLENLRVLCPNCHTQTETWCARNKKNSKRRTYARQWSKNFRVMGQMGRQ